MNRRPPNFVIGDSVVVVGDILAPQVSTPGVNPTMESMAADKQVRTVLTIHKTMPWVQLSDAMSSNGHVFWWHVDWLEHARCEMI